MSIIKCRAYANKAELIIEKLNKHGIPYTVDYIHNNVPSLKKYIFEISTVSRKTEGIAMDITSGCVPL